MIRKLIYKMRKRRFCKLNRWFCPDCIYHDFVFEGTIFRGNKCRYPKYGERREERGMTREEEEAIEVLKNATIEPPWGGSFSATGEALYMAIEALKANRPKGEWIMHGEPPWYVRECSECGTKWHHWSGDSNPNYCGHCGADMRGEDE